MTCNRPSWGKGSPNARPTASSLVGTYRTRERLSERQPRSQHFAGMNFITAFVSGAIGTAGNSATYRVERVVDADTIALRGNEFDSCR
jgi:hypothetical protein